jgi:hypothetical protein
MEFDGLVLVVKNLDAHLILGILFGAVVINIANQH